MTPRNIRWLWLPFCLLLMAAGCSGRSPVHDFPRTPTYAFPQEQTTRTPLGQMAASLRQGAKGQSGFHLLPNGTEAFLTRLGIVNAAEKSLDLQYFSTHDDTTGKLLLDAVWRAVNRGVRVRLLLDDWNLDDFEKGVVALNANPHIEIRVFNPYVTEDQSPFARLSNAIADADLIGRRMHNKAIIADNQMAVMGGRNLGDEYFDASKEFNFRDMDVLAMGPIVSAMSNNFDRYWNSAESYPLDALQLPPSRPVNAAAIRDDWKLHREWALHSHAGKIIKNFSLLHQLKTGQMPVLWANAELVADSPYKIETPPDKAQSKPELRLGELVRAAHKEFIIMTPYFVPLEDGKEWLLAIARRHVKVRVVTNSLASTDMVMVHAGYSHYREDLLAGGVELHELKAQGSAEPKHMFKASSQSSLHAKVYVVDRRNLVIGSFNMDPRSIRYNTEQVLVIHSPTLAKEVVKIFERVISPANSYQLFLKHGPHGERHIIWVTEEHDHKRTFTNDPGADAKRHLMDSLFSILPIDQQL